MAEAPIVYERTWPWAAGHPQISPEAEAAAPVPVQQEPLEWPRWWDAQIVGGQPRQPPASTQTCPAPLTLPAATAFEPSGSTAIRRQIERMEREMAAGAQRVRTMTPDEQSRIRNLLQTRKRVLAQPRHAPERLYRIRETALQMIDSRGYAPVAGTPGAMPFTDFLERFGSLPKRESFVIKAHHKRYQEKQKLGVLFVENVVPLSEQIKACRAFMEQESMLCCILVTETIYVGVPPDTEAVFNNVHVFQEDDLIINFRDLEPPHKIMYNDYMDRFRLQYPHITKHTQIEKQISDCSPLARYYGIPTGTLVTMLAEPVEEGNPGGVDTGPISLENIYVVVPWQEMPAGSCGGPG